MYYIFMTKNMCTGYKKLPILFNFCETRLLNLHFLKKSWLSNLPGNRCAMDRVTVRTVIRTLSANGSNTVPRVDFCPLKFLAIYPSNCGKI